MKRIILLAAMFLPRTVLVSALLLPLLCWGQGARKDDIAIAGNGRLAAGALVRVCTASGTPCPLATLYTDLTLGTACTGSNGCSNPTNADNGGNYHFYAAAGCYLVQVSYAGTTFEMRDQCIGTVAPNLPTWTTGLISGTTAARAEFRPGKDAHLTHLYVVADQAWTNCTTAATVEVKGPKDETVTVAGGQQMYDQQHSVTRTGPTTFTSTNPESLLGKLDLTNAYGTGSGSKAYIMAGSTPLDAAVAALDTVVILWTPAAGCDGTPTGVQIELEYDGKK